MTERVDRLVVTVGTSLFSSASWECTGKLASISNYKRWSTALLEEPLQRRASGKTTSRALEELLRTDEEEALRAFAWPGVPLRYGAELSTLLNWMGKQGYRNVLGDFLDDCYGRVELVAPSDREDPARIAADHLLEVMKEPIGARNVEIRDVLTSPSIRDRVGHFRDYLQGIARTDERVDLVVSGGYKVFAMYAAVCAAQRRGRWRVIYLHETSYRELIVQDGSDEGIVFDVDGTRILSDAGIIP